MRAATGQQVDIQENHHSFMCLTGGRAATWGSNIDECPANQPTSFIQEQNLTL